MLRPACLLPAAQLSPPHGLLTPRSGTKVSLGCLGPATRRSDAYRDGTLTRWTCAACSSSSSPFRVPSSLCFVTHHAGSFSSPTIAALIASGTAAPRLAGVRARPPARPPGWPGQPTATTSAVPYTSHACRLGAPRIRATAWAGFGRPGRYKIPCRRKCLMRLRNVPIVPRFPRRPRPWRYKIS